MNNDLQSSDAKPAEDDVNAAAVTSTADEPSVSPMELDFNIDDDDVFDISRVELDDDDDDNEQHNGEEEEASGASIAQRYGFEIGDLVWGKVNSHPWWPGHVFNEAFETSHVRRTRPSGHVLVAFFGDSSFGWFDPAELVPFEPHFADKSRHQSSFSNNLNNNKLSFTRAVEEAVDEANRRCGAAFVCRCRNADNFKESSSVPGYVIVDVPGYEKGAVYSTEMIRKAREGFDPIEIVSTVRELGKAPLVGGDRESLGFVRRRASVLAYRKAVFEEFDETYAEAFGATVADNQPVKPRAPLSGPLVIAESLSARKSATKPVKVKDNSKKDKYLFKRRDEASSSGGGVLGGKKLKKRALPINMSQISTNSSAVSQGIKDEPSQSLKQEGEGPMQVNYEDSAKLSGLKGDNELNEVRVGPGVGDSVPSKKKSSAGKKVIGGVKKENFLKRTRDDMNPAMSDMEDKQKKRKKIQLGSKAGFRDPQSTVTSGKISSLVGRDAGNANHADLPQEDFKEKKDVLDNSLYESSGLLSILTEVELPQLVSDLQSLAIDPFHVSETNNHSLVQQFFVQYRPLVYQKSLIRSPPSEIEPLEGHIAKTSSGVKASQVSPLEPVPSLKSAKPLVRADDGTLLGRKRPPSDRQGEIAAKKSKKMSDRKLLAAERKIGVKIQETQHVEVYESAVPIPRRVKQGLVKKIEPPAKVVEPTMLVMKFPPADSLPSPAELKAKFARFGPTDQSALRVFYKSATCRVVFLYKSDAHAAFKFMSANKSFIGNLNVRLLLREVEAPASGKGYGDENSTETLRAKDSANSPTSALKQRQQQSLSHSALQPKSILKKSSGDDPRGQVTGGNGNSSKRTPRVKFMLGDEEPSRNKFNSSSFADDDDDDGEPSSTTTTSSVAMMNYNARNFQKLTPQSPLPPSTLPPLLALPNSRPLPSPYANPPPPHSNISQQHSDMLLPPPPSRNNPSLFKTQTTFPSASSVDISQQMLSLLTRCNDVVTNVKSHLGYVPYHPL